MEPGGRRSRRWALHIPILGASQPRCQPPARFTSTCSQAVAAARASVRRPRAPWPGGPAQRPRAPQPGAPCQDPAPHGPALRAETPRPTARRFHSLQTQQPFPVPDRISGPESPAPAPRWLHRLRRLGSTCARVRAPVQKGCVGCARARAEGVRGLRARPCSRGTCTARAPLQKGCVGCARACVEGVRGLRARPCRRGAHACTRVSHIYGESHGWDSRGRAVSPSPSRRLHSALARCGEGFSLGAESAPCGCRPFAAPTLGFGPPPVK